MKGELGAGCVQSMRKSF